jgi:ParB family chromosome partitioning protein
MTSDLPRTGTVGLGRGLAALIPQREEQQATVELPIAAISHNPYQPRQSVDQAQLDDLAASIATHGVLQPVLVTHSADGYRLIAGERRLRAAQMAGLDRIPALVRPADESAQLAWALIENLQRSDLNALDEARAFRRLISEFGLSQEEVGQRVGRSRSTIANTLRLLELDERVQSALQQGQISEGHARALAGLEDGHQQSVALEQVVARSLSVRQTEELVRRMRTPGRQRSNGSKVPSEDAERLEHGLREALATKVTLTSSRKGGKITIEYYDEDDLARLYERLTGSQA